MRKILLTLLTTLLCSATAWATDFTAAQIATTSGTSLGNITVKSSFSSTSSKKFCNESSQAGVSINGSGGGDYNANYIEIKAATDYTISSLSVIGASDGTSARTLVIVFWTGDAGATYSSYTTLAMPSNAATSGTGCSGAAISVPANTKTIRLYRQIYIKDGAISGASGKTQIGEGSTVNIKSISATAVSSGGGGCASAPSISVSPASASYCKDASATALSFTGTGHTAQKWQYYDEDSWEDIDGATSATYTPSTSATGSTQYRVVTTCDSYSTNTTNSSAATVTVKANHSVTAATSTGNNTYGTVAAASASVCEGSTTTVTASPASGYKVTNWAVTGTDASISPSGASNSNTTTLTMGTADATVTVTFGCKAPTSPSVSGTTAYTEGDDISLTASATGTSASVTYTWYKGATWDAASATSSIHSGAILSINDCVEDNAGTYWCNISNGTGCDVQTSKTITVSGACTDPGLTITLN